MVPAEDDPGLVPGRECGPCTVCCTALTIRDPELQKPQGYRCRNLVAQSCSIYASRPKTCSSFFCGWRRLKWIRDTLRPDTSGVLVRLHNEVSRTTGTTRPGVVFTLLSGAALKAEGLAESIAAAVHADIPVFLNIPGPPGHTSAQAKLNEALAGPVYARDKPGVLAILRQARLKSRSGPTVPIRL